MGRFLIALGFVILLLGIAYISGSFDNFSAIPEPIDLGSLGVQGALPIPPQELTAALEEANKAADAAALEGGTRAREARGFLFAVFVIGALISILAGWKAINEKINRETAWMTLALGILGAGSAITTSGAQYVQGLADGRFTCVGSIESAARDTLVNVKAETDELAARQYLADMRRDIAQCS
jgi:hypothetical protein